jgi:hypothetical protein
VSANIFRAEQADFSAEWLGTRIGDAWDLASLEFAAHKGFLQ